MAAPVPYTSVTYDPKDEERWHELRLCGLGGSESSAIVGLNPYKQSIEVYYEKRQEIPRQDLSDNERVMFGNILEDVIAQEYSRRTGDKIARQNQLLRSKENPFMIANIDRRIVGEKRGLEVKNVDRFVANMGWGAAGTDEVPEYYLLQCQHYMSVTGYPEWTLVALIGGNELRIYNIKRNDQLIADLVRICGEFWQGVLDGVPPELDYNAPSVTNTIKRIYPGTDGTTIELDNNLQKWCEIERESLEHAKQYTQAAKAAKAHIQMAMKESAIAKFPDGTGYTRKVIKKKSFKVEATEYMDMRYKKEIKE